MDEAVIGHSLARRVRTLLHKGKAEEALAVLHRHREVAEYLEDVKEELCGARKKVLQARGVRLEGEFGSVLKTVGGCVVVGLYGFLCSNCGQEVTGHRRCPKAGETSSLTELFAAHTGRNFAAT
ncbi:MAG: hypothetical protein HY397_02305 [Candidatus Doudnabacteria bacterium]|nr:hypothetical protein [Candidatus Doudnabacteria bacterium]